MERRAFVLGRGTALCRWMLKGEKKILVQHTVWSIQFRVGSAEQYMWRCDGNRCQM